MNRPDCAHVILYPELMECELLQQFRSFTPNTMHIVHVSTRWVEMSPIIPSEKQAPRLHPEDHMNHFFATITRETTHLPCVITANSTPFSMALCCPCRLSQNHAGISSYDSSAVTIVRRTPLLGADKNCCRSINVGAQQRAWNVHRTAQDRRDNSVGL